jgi:hypothetical protein
MAKLTLSVDAGIVKRAKQYAKRQGISVSAMVEAYLAAVAEPSAPATRETPVLRSLRGVLKRAEIGGYRKRLGAKYR